MFFCSSLPSVSLPVGLVTHCATNSRGEDENSSGLIVMAAHSVDGIYNDSIGMFVGGFFFYLFFVCKTFQL